MDKKTGVILAVFGGGLLLCCGGMIFTLKSTVSRIQEMLVEDQKFAKDALTATANEWKVETFMEYATKEFAEPEKAEKTKKMFAVFKEKLGKLTLLEEVKPIDSRKPLRVASERSQAQGIFVYLKANAKFEKGSGAFEVTVWNQGNKKKISEIKLKSDKLFDLPTEDAEKLKKELKDGLEKSKNK